MSEATAPQERVGAHEIFSAFLLIGATSFGGGVVAYLRSSLVVKHRWLDDPSFLEMLSISQTLPGLNATNMAILVGDRLCGWRGAAAGLLGICLPGGLFMFLAGVIYGQHANRPIATAMLHGVAAAAVGLVFSVVVQVGGKSLKQHMDLVFVALTVIGVQVLHLSVPWALLSVGTLAILWYRPRKVSGAEAETS